MAEFVYSGRTADGIVSGTLDAANASAVADLLASRGVTPLEIRESDSSPQTQGLSQDINLSRFFPPKVQTVDLLLFSRQLNILMRSGVPILRALAGLTESATNVAMRNTLTEVRRSLESGLDLSTSLVSHPKVFDNFYVSMVRVGEMTGRLDDVFIRLFKHIEFEQFMRQQVKAALRYPSFVMIAMFVAVGVINAFVIPAFATVFKGFNAELPWMTKLLLATSEFTVNYWWAVLGGLAVAVIAFKRWVSTKAGKYIWDRSLLSFPVAGKIVRKAMLSRFARSFALALKSGVPVAQALGVVAATVENSYIAHKVEGIRESVERGETILRSAALSGIFTPVVLQMIAVGEETGAIDELMEEVADLYTNEVEYELKTLGAQIEPILILFMGLLVLILAMGVFLPVWDLGRTAFKK
ncbi:MAG: MSHA biogenesis protein MshG [Ideonella sp. MAG2]|nr:MAG: MSHA biogenesis protein MshG [Ideonella sp. MAG2]